MLFEFDPEKSKKNKGKHGIDFTEVQAIFANDPLRLPPLTVSGEERSLVIGKIGSTFWTVISRCRETPFRTSDVSREAKRRRDPPR